MNEYDSIVHLKKELKISDDNVGNIPLIFQEIFDELQYEETPDNKKIAKLLDELITECKSINPTLIPYQDITNIIFSEYNGDENEFPFTEKLKSEFEKKISVKFNNQDPKDNKPLNDDELFEISNNQMSLKSNKLIIDNENKNAILVVYKIIQHTELAISQKQSLYEDLKNEIYTLDSTVYNATQQYDNMMSNFISILGIFAAIMMATFGAIQGFTAIFSNENNYSLTTIILISCFGLFALISILYILLYSISRLIDKELGHEVWSNNIFLKYPIYSHTIVAVFVIALFALTHHLKASPPAYFPEHFIEKLWIYTILTSSLLIILYYIHLLAAQSRGYWYLNRQINNYILQVKNFLGVNKLLNILLIMIFAIIILFFTVIIYFLTT